MKTKSEIWVSVIERLGFGQRKFSEMSNSDLLMCVSTAMDEYASQYQQEWIPVEVRLPENNDGLINDTVLFTCGNVVRLGCYDYEDGFWHERYGGKYIDIRSHMKDEIKGGHITHWKHITLPQPYNPKQS